MASGQLGVIVDRSSFDEDDELGFGAGVPLVIEEDKPVTDTKGVKIRNGKVRRKLRWKPPKFRRKNSNVSSNMSVISALTNKSAATNRSVSTTKSTRSTRSFLSSFSRKSQNSFHTFHSTETPVATNKANSPQFPHTMKRPNYPDTFDAGLAAADSKGAEARSRLDSADNVLTTVNEVAVFERSSTLPNRFDGLPTSPMTEAPMSFFDPNVSSAASIASDPFDSLENNTVDQAKNTKTTKSKRPPLFRRMTKKKSRPPSPAETVSSSKDSSGGLVENAVPSLSSSGSPSQKSLELEHDNSYLPVLELENDEGDRRVSLCIGTPRRSSLDMDLNQSGADGNPAETERRSSLSPNSSKSRAAIEASSPSSSPSIKPPVQVKESPVVSSTPTSTSKSKQSPSPRKPYNRPKDTMMQSDDPSPKRRSPKSGSVPVDLDDGAFFEAEHNLRAIHDMAAEHLAHGEYEEAIEVFEEILRGQQERYGSSHYRVGTALHNLAIVHMKAGNYEKGIDICSQAVEIRKDALVPNHPDVAVSLAQLGVAHLECQDHQEALMAFKEALHIRQTFLGESHPKCAKILNNIGCAQYSLNDLENSKLAFEQALNIQRATLRKMPSSEEGQDNGSSQSNTILLSMASTLCNIASIKLQQEEFDEAAVALDEALLIQQSVLGDDHPMVASTLENIQYVEDVQNNAVSSAKTFFGRWTAVTTDDALNSSARDARVCSESSAIEGMLGIDMFDSLAPENWFKQMGDAIATSSCGPAGAVEDSAGPLRKTPSVDLERNLFVQMGDAIARTPCGPVRSFDDASMFTPTNGLSPSQEDSLFKQVGDAIASTTSCGPIRSSDDEVVPPNTLVLSPANSKRSNGGEKFDESIRSDVSGHFSV